MRIFCIIILLIDICLDLKVFKDLDADDSGNFVALTLIITHLIAIFFIAKYGFIQI